MKDKSQVTAKQLFALAALFTSATIGLLYVLFWYADKAKMHWSKPPTVILMFAAIAILAGVAIGGWGCFFDALRDEEEGEE